MLASEAPEEPEVQVRLRVRVEQIRLRSESAVMVAMASTVVMVGLEAMLASTASVVGAVPVAPFRLLALPQAGMVEAGDPEGRTVVRAAVAVTEATLFPALRPRSEVTEVRVVQALAGAPEARAEARLPAQPPQLPAETGAPAGTRHRLPGRRLRLATEATVATAAIHRLEKPRAALEGRAVAGLQPVRMAAPEALAVMRRPAVSLTVSAG